MAVHVLYLYHTLPWLRAVLYEYSCTVILLPVQRTSDSCTVSSTIQLYKDCCPRIGICSDPGEWRVSVQSWESLEDKLSHGTVLDLVSFKRYSRTYRSRPPPRKMKQLD